MVFKFYLPTAYLLDIFINTFKPWAVQGSQLELKQVKEIKGRRDESSGGQFS
jgi:hypothetical protein